MDTTTFPEYPVLLRYRDGSDCDLLIAADSSDLREMEPPDVQESAWDGWDSSHRHFAVVWDPKAAEFLLKESTCEDPLDKVQSEYERVYLAVGKKGQRFRLKPSITKAWIDGVSPGSQGRYKIRFLICHLCERPALYVGRGKICLVGAYIDGFAKALVEFDESTHGAIPWSYFQRWVEHQFQICEPDWHWTRILLHATGNHQDAITLIPQLYMELVENGSLPSDGQWPEELIPSRSPVQYVSTPPDEETFPLTK